MTLKLLAVFFKERFGFSRLFGQNIARSPIKKFFMVLLLVYAFGVTSFSIGELHYELAITLQSTNTFDPLLDQVFSYVIGIGFLFSFFQARGTLYAYKDFNILGALPIKQRSVSLSKMLLMTLFIVGFALIITLPIIGIYSWFSALSWYELILGLIAFMILPIPVIILGSILSILVYRLTIHWINPRLVQTVLTFSLLSVYLVFNVLQLNQSNDAIQPIFVDTYLAWYVPREWFIESFSGQLGSFFLLLMTHIGLLIGFMVVLSQWMLSLNQLQYTNRFNGKHVIPKKTQSVMMQLIKKEWGRYVNSPIYILNTGFGLIMLLVGSFVLLWIPEVLVEVQAALIQENISIILLVIGFIGFTLSTVYSPAVSLSLEGKNINMLKSLPIDPMLISTSKIGFNLILSLPVIVVSWSALSVALSFELMTSFSLLSLIIALMILFSVFFFWMNVFFPRFDFQQDVEVVKQSIAALVAVFGGFAIVAGVIVMFIFLPPTFDEATRMWTITSILLMISGGLYMLMKRFITRFFNSFSV
jgi:ABC-2 type transport system permease protein